MKYGAYYNRREDDMVWFRTARPLEAGFYRRHARSVEPPDVYIADSVPELIMKVYPCGDNWDVGEMFPCPNRIQVNIPHQFQKIALLLTQKRFIPVLK
jgi:hypothetical protein